MCCVKRKNGRHRCYCQGVRFFGLFLICDGQKRGRWRGRLAAHAARFYNSEHPQLRCGSPKSFNKHLLIATQTNKKLQIITTSDDNYFIHGADDAPKTWPFSKNHVYFCASILMLPCSCFCPHFCFSAFLF